MWTCFSWFENVPTLDLIDAKLRVMEVVVTDGAIRRAKLQSNHHQPQTTPNICFIGQMPFLSPNQQCQSCEGKRSCRNMYFYYYCKNKCYCCYCYCCCVWEFCAVCASLRDHLKTASRDSGSAALAHSPAIVRHLSLSLSLSLSQKKMLKWLSLKTRQSHAGDLTVPDSRILCRF